jgi:hypothetical protein
MATTTPNFGWPVPTSTDLVKDGATAMEALGDAIDTSMVDLKGGTTGQVLAKASNTDMDFSWVAQDDSNAIQNTIVDAKGDLIAASAADTPARLAVGNNGETLVADSSATTGLRYQGNFSAGKNKIINGDFGIWQRGTSFNTAANLYTADRWLTDISGTPTTATVTRQTFTPGAAPVAGYEGSFFLRSTITTVGTLSNLDLLTRIEDCRTFAGQTVTLSFWAKSDTARTSLVYLYQNTGSGGSGSAFGTPSTPALTTTTSWARYSFTIALGSLSGATIGTNSYLQVAIRQAVAAGSVLDIWGVQVEAGSVATAFQTATGTIQGELAACQRYYERIVADASYGFIGNAYAFSTTAGYVVIPFKTNKRITPSVMDTSAAGTFQFDDGATGYTPSALAISTPLTNTNFGALQATGTSGMTQYRPALFVAKNSSTAFIGFSAEL